MTVARGAPAATAATAATAAALAVRAVAAATPAAEELVHLVAPVVSTRTVSTPAPLAPRVVRALPVNPEMLATTVNAASRRYDPHSGCAPGRYPDCGASVRSVYLPDFLTCGDARR
ncbi:hypothetical protein F0Q45_19530 [Mycobacterium simiae]|uniref:Secreted protein n=1 Tax=Mycobacterium simiae TaxID=1784 RepID=A0A5B1BLA2_MYCSI|nr:hypothetical protein F0Q45_19530 [Mycobacterium simiae]